MEANEIIDDIRKALKPIKDNNEKTVSVEALENFLSTLAVDAGSSNHQRNRDQNHNLATFQAENERWIKKYEIESNHAIEMFRSVIDSGQSALKASMIINGGAAIALLAFVGNMLKEPPIKNIQDLLSIPIWLFCLGVLCSAMAAGGMYLTQFLYSSHWLKTGASFHVITILIVLTSYLLFGVAAYNTIEAFIPSE